MAIVSKNGTDFYDIPDDEENLAIAKQKGYSNYLQVTKNGTDYFAIPAEVSELNTARSKGYMPDTEWAATSKMKDERQTQFTTGEAAAQGVAELDQFSRGMNPLGQLLEQPFPGGGGEIQQGQARDDRSELSAPLGRGPMQKFTHAKGVTADEMNTGETLSEFGQQFLAALHGDQVLRLDTRLQDGRRDGSGPRSELQHRPPAGPCRGPGHRPPERARTGRERCPPGQPSPSETI